MNNTFRDFMKEARPMRFKEPLAETLGAFQEKDAVLEYTYIDAVKMAGHACPTVTGAYICCQAALQRLYGDEIPVRGEIAVTVYGGPAEGVYGVMAQVFSFLTGAAGETGFKGLGHLFKRKDLLRFKPEKIDPEAMCFEFSRTDNNKKVLVRFYPQRIPFAKEKVEELGRLMHPVIWEAATEEEKKRFQDLWMGKVENMLIRKDSIEQWLQIEDRQATG
ncbi:MAG: hypothetical protein Q8O55_10885 [Dehalococcoidales bacterium]|nr:hypothetical protein [Dehalococcoidales bacterium]